MLMNFRKIGARKKNIVFFTVSDDEHLSFGKEMNPNFTVNQNNYLKNM